MKPFQQETNLMAITLSPVSNKKPTDISIKRIDENKLRRVGRVRTDLDRLYTEAETKARAEYLGLHYIDLYGFPIDTSQLIFINKTTAEKLLLGVFLIKNKDILMASPMPGRPGQSEYIKSLKNDGYNPVVHLCSELSFEKILHTYEYVVEVKESSDDIVLSQTMMDDDKNQADTNLEGLRNLGKRLQEISLSEIVETVLVAALKNKASDIHFEPEKTSYNLRFRLDGVLHTFAKLPVEMRKTVESRLKLVSGLKLNVDNVPQDGRFSFKASGKDIDVRVSMLPSNYGYSIVMRLLGTGDVALDLIQLGFTGLAKKRVEMAIQKPQGMILTTGPTGSGKTTTLYTFLKTLNDGETKIITLEDPVEYKLEGVSQTQIDSKAGYTFGSGLRSILRQDPDIVMVGEIRDPETADTAVQASLTGHQVLSTVHTNDAAGAIPRLMEMGIKGFLLADSLSAVIGQRLIRKICPYCKQEDHLNDDQKAMVIEQLQKLPQSAGIKLPPKVTFYTSKGCDKCNGLGYKGRVGAYEVMTVTEGLKNLLSEQFPSIMQVRQIAQQEGMITMLQDAILKALEGLTDIKEIQENIS
jgi:type IV pilus assembly protein PilB